MARSRRMARWWAANRPTAPASQTDALAERADVEALWRWVRALMREGLRQRHQEVPPPPIGETLVARWRRCVTELVDVAGDEGSLHPLDADGAARWVREWLRYDLGHRSRFPRRPATVTDLQIDVLIGVAGTTVLEIAAKYPARRGDRELLAVRLARASR